MEFQTERDVMTPSEVSRPIVGASDAGSMTRCGRELPLDAGVGDEEAVPLGVALRATAGSGAHHREVAAVLGGVAEADVEESEVRALAAHLGRR
jgi:hypothetical protein